MCIRLFGKRKVTVRRINVILNIVIYLLITKVIWPVSICFFLKEWWLLQKWRFFFSFYNCPCGIWKLLGEGLSWSCLCDLCHSVWQRWIRNWLRPGIKPTSSQRQPAEAQQELPDILNSGGKKAFPCAFFFPGQLIYSSPSPKILPHLGKSTTSLSISSCSRWQLFQMFMSSFLGCIPQPSRVVRRGISLCTLWDAWVILGHLEMTFVSFSSLQPTLSFKNTA